MWKMDFLKYLQPVAGPHRRGRGCPFPHPIHCQNRCILIWRGKKCRCRMTEVVLTEQQPPLPVAVLTETFELAAKQRFWKSFSRNHSGMAILNERKPRGAVAT